MKMITDHEELRELRRKIEQANRIASTISDQTTVERLRNWAQELSQKLRQRLAARRTKEEIGARARELWDEHGRPSDRDLEFWLRAERELADDERGATSSAEIAKSESVAGQTG